MFTKSIKFPYGDVMMWQNAFVDTVLFRIRQKHVNERHESWPNINEQRDQFRQTIIGIGKLNIQYTGIRSEHRIIHKGKEIIQK